MIVLIAPEKDIPNELEILHNLFEEGLEYYHLRKPDKGYEEYKIYLGQINSKYHQNIVTHYHHQLLDEFDIKGIHFQEQKRKEELEKRKEICSYTHELEILRSEFTTSSSFHNTHELTDCTLDFDYHLLSPVFSSISKPGYEGKKFDVNAINKKVIGMGGVTTQNLDEFKRMGFKGVGVLGGIWKSDQPVNEFKQMRNYFTRSEYM